MNAEPPKALPLSPMTPVKRVAICILTFMSSTAVSHACSHAVCELDLFCKMSNVQCAKTGLGFCRLAGLCRQYSAGLLSTHIECKHDAMNLFGKTITCSDGHEAATDAVRKIGDKRQCCEDAVMSPCTAVICKGLPLRQKNPWYCTLPSLQENVIVNTKKLCTSCHSSTAPGTVRTLCQYGSQTTAYHILNMIRNWSALKDAVLPRV